jgi:hypothetical protein
VHPLIVDGPLILFHFIFLLDTTAVAKDQITAVAQPIPPIKVTRTTTTTENRLFEPWIALNFFR